MGAMAIPMLMGAAKSIYGLAQGAGNKRPDRPDYVIPEEILEAEKIMQGRVSSGLPGKDIIMDNMGSSFASNLSGIRDVASGGALIGATADMYGGLVKGVRDIELADAQFRDQATLGLVQAKMNTAEARDKAFMLNEYEPYQMDYNEYINRKNAAAQNFFGGLSDIGKTHMANLSSKSMMKMLGKLFGVEVEDEEGEDDEMTGWQRFGAKLFGINLDGE